MSQGYLVWHCRAPARLWRVWAEGTSEMWVVQLSGCWQPHVARVGGMLWQQSASRAGLWEPWGCALLAPELWMGSLAWDTLSMCCPSTCRLALLCCCSPHLAQGKWLPGPLLQAWITLTSATVLSLLGLEQLQKELQGLSGNRQYLFWGRFLWFRKAKPENGCDTLEICLKRKVQCKFCKINVGTSNRHELAVNKFGLEVKFLTVRRIKLLDNIHVAEAGEEFKSNSFEKLPEMGLVPSGLSLYQEAP